jgi:hypothetical protein
MGSSIVADRLRTSAPLERLSAEETKSFRVHLDKRLLDAGAIFRNKSNMTCSRPRSVRREKSSGRSLPSIYMKSMQGHWRCCRLKLCPRQIVLEDDFEIAGQLCGRRPRYEPLSAGICFYGMATPCAFVRCPIGMSVPRWAERWQKEPETLQRLRREQAIRRLNEPSRVSWPRFLRYQRRSRRASPIYCGSFTASCGSRRLPEYRTMPRADYIPTSGDSPPSVCPHCQQPMKLVPTTPSCGPAMPELLA